MKTSKVLLWPTCWRSWRKARSGIARRWSGLTVESYDALVEIMHVNGRLMPGHQPMRVAPETRELVRRIFRPVVQPK